MLDICKQQFLVLFLMMEAQLDPPQRFLRNADRPAFQQPIHRRIHMFAITQNFPQSRPRKGTPQALVRKFCKALVVAVEEPRKVGVEDPVARYKFAQHERLEEPRRMGNVPLGWRGFGTRLYHHVLWSERFTKPQASLPDKPVALPQPQHV